MCVPVCTGAFSLLQGAGVSLWGQGDVLAFLPVLNWTHLLGAQRADDPSSTRTSGHPPPRQPLEVITREALLASPAVRVGVRFALPCGLLNAHQQHV